MHMHTFSSQYYTPLLHLATVSTVAVLNLNKYFIFELKMCSDSISLECICIHHVYMISIFFLFVWVNTKRNVE